MIEQAALKLASAQSDCIQTCLVNGSDPKTCNINCASAPAASSAPITGPGITNPALGAIGKQSGITYLQKMVPRFVTLGLIIGSVVFFFVLLMGAIQWISSGGDKQAIESARGKITNALIGLVILFAVFAILRLIQLFFGVTILTLDIGSLVIQ